MAAQIEDSGTVLNPGSVSLWLGDAKVGDESAATDLFNRYYPLIRKHVHKELRGFATRSADEEDLALSVIATILQRLRLRRLDKLKDRQHLWALLLVMATREVTSHKRRETRQMRDVRRDASVDSANVGHSPCPSPGVIAETNDTREYLFGILRNDQLRQIAAAKLEGYSNDEIARELQITVRTVQRKVNDIYECWDRQLH